jgi:RsiW-degrading membrane proteinase PrsW (M82 family)
MKQFYYELNGQQTGPIAVDELRPLQINGETLIWYEGLSAWTKAKDISELAEYLNKLPPPLPPKRQIKIDSIYDLTYEKETDVIMAGVALLLTPLFLKLIGVFTFDTEQSFHTAQAIFALIALLVRIVVTLWVVAIAGRQNRNTTGWGFYAFFLPSISLINIGCLRRLKVEGQPTFIELKKEEEADSRTEEQKKIDDEKFKRQDKTLRIIIFTMIIGGFVALFAMMFFWR